MLRAFGLGAPTGLDLPGEAPGLVPDREWKDEVIGEPWVLGDTYTFGIGQGYLTVTPIQMAVATAALANGGEVLVPRVVSGFQTAEATTRLEREVVSTLPDRRRAPRGRPRGAAARRQPRRHGPARRAGGGADRR